MARSMVELRARAILFDVDGVLVDSEECVRRHWTRWANDHGMDWRAILPIAHGRRPVETFRLIAPEIDAAAEAARITALEEDDLEGVRPIPEAVELIRSLGQFPWAIVTSGTRRLAGNRLRHVGIELPPVVIAADDVAHGKPAPEGYLAAAGRLGVPPSDAVVIEDTPAGIEAAQRGAMRVVGVATTHDAEDLQRADLVVGSLAELRAEVRTEGDGRRNVRLWRAAGSHDDK